jgi:hypothetical protein
MLGALAVNCGDIGRRHHASCLHCMSIRQYSGAQMKIMPVCDAPGPCHRLLDIIFHKDRTGFTGRLLPPRCTICRRAHFPNDVDPCGHASGSAGQTQDARIRAKHPEQTETRAPPWRALPRVCTKYRHSEPGQEESLREAPDRHREIESPAAALWRVFRPGSEGWRLSLDYDGSSIVTGSPNLLNWITRMMLLSS